MACSAVWSSPAASCDRAERMFARLAAQADRFAAGRRRPSRSCAACIAITAPARQRLTITAGQLAAGPYGHGLAQRLAAEIADGLEVDVERIRPLALARRWGVPERHAIEACLEATRLGMLELRWDLLCPRCRGAKATSSAASTSCRPGAHCGTCNIDYGRDFSRNVELTLRPRRQHPPDRGGRVLPARADEHAAHLGPRHARAGRGAHGRVHRCRPAPTGCGRWRSGRRPTSSTRAGVPGRLVTDDAVVAGASGRARMGDPAQRHGPPPHGGRRGTAAGSRTRSPPTASPRCRRSATCSRPRCCVPATRSRSGRVTLLFSDLKGSTALYDAIGDAAAYGRVREHFAYLAGIVREHDGAIVKTIGDAVMAAFHEPLQGLRAAIAMQERVARVQRRPPAPLVLKLGPARGPVHRRQPQRPARLFRRNGESRGSAARAEPRRRRRDLGCRWPRCRKRAPRSPATSRAPRPPSFGGWSAPVEFVRLVVVGQP